MIAPFSSEAQLRSRLHRLRQQRPPRHRPTLRDMTVIHSGKHAGATLNPRFGPECLVYCNGIRAIYEPDASHELEQAYETATGTPREQVRRNFRGIDQRQTDKDDHDGNVPCTPENVDSENAEKEEGNSHPSGWSLELMYRRYPMANQ